MSAQIERVRELDGLRGIAAAAVIVGHFVLPYQIYLGQSWAVDLFMVLSGYLITKLLLTEREQTGTINLKSFYWRRVCRIMPPLLVLVGTIWFLTLTGLIEYIPSASNTNLSLLTESTMWIAAQMLNWHAVAGQDIAWALTPLWSLAVEEQFYLIWAPMVAFVTARFALKQVGWVAAALACISAVWGLWLLAQGDSTINHFKHGTDTAAASLLCGAVFAVTTRSHQFRQIATWFFIPATLFVTLGLAGQLGGTVNTSWRYLFAGSSGIIIVACVEHARGTKWLCHRWMQWLGNRSYALYLYHWVFVIGLAAFDAPGQLIGLLLTGIVAELSWRYVEQPALAYKHKYSRPLPVP